jgi:Ca2+-binding RTX toxin-like protein
MIWYLTGTSNGSPVWKNSEGRAPSFQIDVECRAGNDLVSFASLNNLLANMIAGISVSGGTGDDRFFGPDQATLSGIIAPGAKLFFDGERGFDTFVGGVNAEEFQGGPDADTANGRGGKDILVSGWMAGGLVDDTDDSLATFNGGPDDDRLVGGPMSDRLVGGEGRDTIDGRGGSDTWRQWQ